jgi:hypothetical protein
MDEAKVQSDAAILKNIRNLLKLRGIQIFKEGCGRGTKLNRARTIFQEEAPGAAFKTELSG